MKKKYLSFFIVLLLFASACEKEVNIELPEPEAKLVIEGWIEQDQYATIAITRNSSYFSPVDSSTLANLFILDAEVFISNGTETEKLEIDFSNAINMVWPFICYKGKVIKGEIGKTYTLKIYAEGDTITGKTTIPNPVQLDSIWWMPDDINKPLNDTLGYIWATFTDNPNEKNYYRLFAKRVGRDNDFVPLFGSVYDDMFFDDKSFTFSMYRGIQTFSDADAISEDKEIFYFKKGDSVIVKITSIDKEHHYFWRTIEQENYMGGNPFMYPPVIRHNVEGALGVFGGYGATYYYMQL